MKKCIRILALVLAMTMLLSVTALAAGVENQAQGASVAFQDGNEKLSVSYSDAAIQANGQYLILVVKGTLDSFTIQEDTILYIDQAQAAEAGTVTFSNVYPSSIQDSVVLISGAGLSGPVILAAITVPYELGDVDLDGSITSADAVALNQHLAAIKMLTGNSLMAADTDRDGQVTAADAVRLNQYLAGIIIEF